MADHLAHTHAGQWHHEVRQDGAEEAAEAHEGAVDEAKEGRIIAGGHRFQGVGGYLVIFRPHDAVDEVHGKGHAIGVAQEVGKLFRGGVLLIGGGGEPGVGLGRGGVDKRGVNVSGLGYWVVSVRH